MASKNCRMLFIACIAVLLFAANYSVAYSAPPQYQLIDLGTLGGATSVGNSINNAGWVAGTSAIAGGANRAYLYNGTTMINLGTLGGASSEGNAINNSGVVVGSAKTAAGFDHAFKYSGSPMVDIGSGAINEVSSANAINDIGVVVGKATNGAFYHNGTYNYVGTYGANNATPYGINNNTLEWVGTVTTTVGFTQKHFPYRYFNGSFQTYTIPTDGEFSNIAYDINNSQTWVGAISHRGPALPFGPHLRATVNGALLPSLNNLSDLSIFDAAKSINELGQVVGNSKNRAVIWEGTSAIYDLNSFATVGAAGWTLNTANGINDNGWITGTGTFSGQSRAFILRPIPEPGTISMVIIGGVGLLWRLRRKS